MQWHALYNFRRWLNVKPGDPSMLCKVLQEVKLSVLTLEIISVNILLTWNSQLHIPCIIAIAKQNESQTAGLGTIDASTTECYKIFMGRSTSNYNIDNGKVTSQAFPSDNSDDLLGRGFAPVLVLMCVFDANCLYEEFWELFEKAGHLPLSRYVHWAFWEK